MKKIYYLSTCSTCDRIMKDLGIDASWEQQCIKTDSITKKQLEEMHKMAGSYESLFSRRAMKFRGWGLHEKQLSEADYKKYILEEYTFLRRPVFIIDKEIFIGNTKKMVEQVREKITN